MATLALPAPRRFRFDARIAVGVLLVALSAAGTTALVGALERTTTVYRAAEPLTAGVRITADDLVPTPVRLGQQSPLYLAGTLPQAGYVVTRTVAQGELVPLSALGSVSGVDTARIVVPLSTRLAGTIGVGTVVDLWAAPKKAGSATEFGAPVVLVSGATVSKIGTPRSGMLATQQDNTVEVQVPRDEVAGVLQAVAGGAQLSAVAVAAPVQR
ncbi:hypothetical protein QDR37_03190 [Amnibacterium sp. CER49]|uniref:hypothetical protein n=1 Tax=Amnibacterium sp. CER49 TaxID=3039161 RepID=UPI00244CFA15|nr:hypothetical protein [Amnibacterium sp. CER49]MDH2442943.1 hypothetical protein [Amnibacterium sp. CER49]